MTRREPRAWSARHWLALAGCAALVSAAGLAQGDTLVFRDEARGKARGKILAEFEDVLFVALDGGSTTFVARAELRAIDDDEGQRFEAPQPGTFARFAGPAPAGAVTDVQGEVFVQGVDEAEGGLVAAQEHAFVRPGDRVKAGADALARLLLTSNAQLKLSPGSEVVLDEPQGRERVKLVRGELFADTHLRPLELGLAGAVRVDADADTRLELSAGGGAIKLLLHQGRAEAVWADARLSLTPGTGAQLVATGAAQWRVSADEANVDDLQVHLPAGTERLAPGESRSFGAHPDREGAVWRLLTSRGELLLRRAQAEAFGPVSPDELELLVLGEGDALRTAAQGSATLGRIDGAAVTLAAATHLRAAPGALELSQGELQVESVASPVKVKTPGGVAGLRQSIVRLTRRDAFTLALRCQAGTAEVPLSELGVLRVGPGAGAELTAPPEGAARLRLTEGQAVFATRAPADGYDPDVQVQLRPGDEVGMEPDAEGRPILHLPGARWLRCDGPGIRARVSLAAAEPLIAFESGAQVVMLEGLRMGLGRADGVPELRFRSGPRLRLGHPFRLQVHNPTAIVEGPGGAQSTLELEGELQASLDEGGEHALASLAVRDEDRLELLGGVEGASLVRTADQHRYAFGDGRQLWIADGAPPVQARLSDPQGTAYLTMPGAPALGLAAGRPIVVLATAEGDFVVVAGGGGALGEGLDAFAGPGLGSPVDRIARDRLRDLLDVPQVDSPSGP